MFKKICLLFLISMIPIVELRGAIPIGVGWGLPLWLVYIVCVVGNMVPVPFIILFIRKIFEWMKKRGGWMESLVLKMEEKAEKGAKLFYKYELLGLFILVAIPLPGTGAWTGALVAAMLEIRIKTAVPVIAAGVATAGLVMMILSYYGVMVFF